LPLFSPTYQQLISDGISDLDNYTNITRLSAGSKARAILEAVGRRLKESYNTFDLNLARAFVSAATGQYLDLIGILLGVDREKASSASVSSEMEVQRFYVESGTFGDINGSADIYLPQATVISTEANGSGRTYRLLSGLLLSASDTEGYAAIEATLPGSDANVGSNSLVFHDFTGYSDFDNNSLLTTNVFAIANGRDYESDANYRYRIVNRVLEGEAANVTAIRLAALSGAGVADIIVKRRYKGIGTFAVIIQSTTPTVSDALIANVRVKVEQVMSAGEYAYIMKPKEIGLTFRTTLYFKKKLTDDEMSTIESDLDEIVSTYVNSLNIAEDFSSNHLVSDMYSVSEDIDFGVPGKPLEEIYIYRDSRLEDNRLRQKLLGDYAAEEDERVIIETTVSNPIVFNRQYK